MFEFRRLTQGDLPMLTEWLGRAHVAEWWGPPPSLDDVRAKYTTRCADDADVRPYIAWLDGEAVGYIQSYAVAGSGDGWWPDETDPGARGIDQFLADGDRLSTGLGTRLVTAFLALLFADPDVTKVQADPSPANARAIRCYEKCGFRRKGVVETPDGAALLMIVRRADIGG